MFRERTFRGVCTNFESFIPISYKHGLVNTLIFRCFKICSSYEKLHNEIYLKEFFKRNRYPNDFVGLCIKKFFDKLYITKKKYQTVEKNQLMIILPFWGNLSFETENRLNSCIRNQIPSCSLRIAFQSKTRLFSLFKFRESIPKYFRLHLLLINFSVAAATQLIMVKLRDIFLCERRSIWKSLH